MEVLEKAKQLKAELDSFRPLTGEIEARIMQKFRLDWNYHSNKLEGNSYTYGETKMLILYGLTAGGKPINDYKEISGHNEAIETIIDVIKDKTPLTETFIRHLHTLILEEQWVEAKTADGKPTKRLIKVGEYKTEPNHVKTVTGEMFYFAEPIETPAKMQELIEWFNEKKASKDTNPIFLAAEFHYKFIRIHPFDDGNGRMARLLMNFILMQNSFPPVIIKDTDKASYIAVLRQADVGIIQPFIAYIAENLVRSLEIMLKGARGESIEEADDLDKELALLERKLEIDRNMKVVEKTPDILKAIFDEVVLPLIKEFIKISSKFNRFFISKKLWSVSINHVFDISETEQLFSSLKKLMNDDPNSVGFTLNYNHDDFLNPKFPNINLASEVSFIFRAYSYKISIRERNNSANIEIEKKYSDAISHEELYSALNLIAKSNKDFIEKMINPNQSSP